MIKSLEYVRNQIIKLKDDLQHYTMVEKDSVLASQIKYDLEQFENIEKELKALEIIKNKKLDVCSFINNFVERNNSYETYVLYFEKPIEIDYVVISEELLTEEEFNLVKDVLKGDVK